MTTLLHHSELPLARRETIAMLGITWHFCMKTLVSGVTIKWAGHYMG